MLSMQKEGLYTHSDRPPAHSSEILTLWPYENIAAIRNELKGIDFSILASHLRTVFANCTCEPHSRAEFSLVKSKNYFYQRIRRMYR